MKYNYKRIKNFLSLRIEKIVQNIKMYIFYSRLIKKNDICFDVGANVGNRTDVFLKLGAIVVVVEPQKECFEILKKKYINNRNIILVNTALGEKEGEAEMMIGDASTISSISKDWINSVKSSGRFGNLKWDKSYTVPVTTLDYVIKNYGRPSFCKIDVEGFEYEVLRGLSAPIKLISFEFTPELIHTTLNCVDYLSSIGKYEYNYSLGESMKFELIEYVSDSDINTILKNFSGKTIFGDIYAKQIV